MKKKKKTNMRDLQGKLGYWTTAGEVRAGDYTRVVDTISTQPCSLQGTWCIVDKMYRSHSAKCKQKGQVFFNAEQ